MILAKCHQKVPQFGSTNGAADLLLVNLALLQAERLFHKSSTFFYKPGDAISNRPAQISIKYSGT